MNHLANNSFVIIMSNNTVITIYCMNITATNSQITATLMGSNVSLTVPNTLQSCITNYTYSFQGASGNIDAGVENIMLSLFNLESCNAPALVINPVILNVATPSAGASVDICVPGEWVTFFTPTIITVYRLQKDFKYIRI